MGKILVSLLVPVMLAAYRAAFSWRSIVAGAVVLALIAVVEVTWGVVDGAGSGAAAWWSRHRHRTAAGRMAG